MEPIPTTRSVRDESGGNLTLNFQFKSSLMEILYGWIDLIRRKQHGIDLVLGIGSKKNAQGVELIP